VIRQRMGAAPGLLLRRELHATAHGLPPDVTGNPPVAQYADEPRKFDGFVFPTHRRVLRHDTDGIADQSFAAITVDIQSIAVDQT
jgi:hypothetical protein